MLLAILGHLVGWPIVAGGSRGITNALVHYLEALGGHVTTRKQVDDLTVLPPVQALLLDLTPIQIADVARSILPRRYRTRLRRFRYGPGVYKIDWALKEPIPWKAAECRRSATVHLGGAFREIVESEAAVARGQHPARPFVLLTQPSLFDTTRAPNGFHTAWAYCHVPSGSDANMTPQIEAQVERFAPGFGDTILTRSTFSAQNMAHHNANLVGGDISGGAVDLRQLVARPAFRFPPHTTPMKGIYVCSSSTPPGPGVHGLCGYLAARSAIRRMD
jgi:phytoene dehydrogenase-like protein